MLGRQESEGRMTDGWMRKTEGAQSHGLVLLTSADLSACRHPVTIKAGKSSCLSRVRASISLTPSCNGRLGLSKYLDRDGTHQLLLFDEPGRGIKLPYARC